MTYVMLDVKLQIPLCRHVGTKQVLVLGPSLGMCKSRQRMSCRRVDGSSKIKQSVPELYHVEA
jgi:hypothetical protein